MDDFTTTLPASWEYLRAWLQRHIVEHPPGDEKHEVRTLQMWGRRGDLYKPYRNCYRVAIVGFVNIGVLPLLEFTICSSRRDSEVTARCNEPDRQSYFRGLLVAIAEQWPESKDAVTEYIGKLPELTPPHPVYPEITKRREDVRDLWQRPMTISDIAKAVGFSESTVKRDLKELGLSQRQPK